MSSIVQIYNFSSSRLRGETTAWACQPPSTTIPLSSIAPRNLRLSYSVSIPSIHQTMSSEPSECLEMEEVEGPRLKSASGTFFCGGPSARARMCLYMSPFGQGSPRFGKHQYTEHEIPGRKEDDQANGTRRTAKADTGKDKERAVEGRGVEGGERHSREGVSCQPPYIMPDVGSDSHIVSSYVDR